jgi:hypothetical protein
VNNVIKDRINAALGRSLTNRKMFVEVRVADLAAVMGDAQVATPVPPLGKELGPFVWLWTHCRAIGMTAKSDSGSMENDIALFTINLDNALTKTRELLEDCLGPVKDAENNANDVANERLYHNLGNAIRAELAKLKGKS